MVSGILKTLSLLFKVLVVHYRRSWRGSFLLSLSLLVYVLMSQASWNRMVYSLETNLCVGFFLIFRFYPLVKLGHVLVSLEVKVMFYLLV